MGSESQENSTLDEVANEEEFSRKMADEVFGDANGDDLDLYVIEQEEIKTEGVDVESELHIMFREQKHHEDPHLDNDLKRQERAKEVLVLAK